MHETPPARNLQKDQISRSSPEKTGGGAAVVWAGVFALIVIPCAVMTGVWFLPSLFIDEAGLSQQEIQSAQNAARTPIGIGLAASLAAATALAGVFVNHRNVQVARDGLTDAETRHRDDIRQAGGRANDERFARGVELLGHETASVRGGALHMLHGLAKADPTSVP